MRGEGTEGTRRAFLRTAAAAAVLGGARRVCGATREEALPMDDGFYVRAEELDLRYAHPLPEARLARKRWVGSPEKWRAECKAKLGELLAYAAPAPSSAECLRSARQGSVTVEAWVMDAERGLRIPAYLLRPDAPVAGAPALMAIHGHGSVEAVVGQYEDYHHAFGMYMAERGWVVLCPALRGFGPLANLSSGDPERCLDYWSWDRGPQFSLVTDGFVHGRTLVGDTVADLVRWEDWLANEHGVASVAVAGISDGGDLAVPYPVFSKRVRRIYASGTMGSFSVVFGRCYNAPAHCIPHVLRWMDRADIAGLNAPRPLRLHYGELDTPGPGNNSAALNETV